MFCDESLNELKFSLQRRWLKSFGLGNTPSTWPLCTRAGNFWCSAPSLESRSEGNSSIAKQLSQHYTPWLIEVPGQSRRGQRLRSEVPICRACDGYVKYICKWTHWNPVSEIYSSKKWVTLWNVVIVSHFSWKLEIYFYFLHTPFLCLFLAWLWSPLIKRWFEIQQLDCGF